MQLGVSHPCHPLVGVVRVQWCESWRLHRRRWFLYIRSRS